MPRILFKFWLTEIPLKRVNFKKEMYNTMNSYHKYTSIPKSSFNKINILILPINTGKNIENIPYILPISATTSHYGSNFPYREVRKFHDVM